MSNDSRTLASSDCDRELPPEITDDIISRLHMDRHSLFACSLVHPTWQARSQSLIFRRIRITGDDGGEFLQLLIESPHIARYVRLLLVDETRSQFEDLEVMPTLLALLSNLNELIIRRPRHQWPRNTRPMKDFPPGSSPPPMLSVQKITLEVDFFGGRDMAQFLAHFPLLEDLSLSVKFLWFGDVLTLNNPEIEFPPLPPPPSHLKTLNIGDADLDGAVYNWFASSPSLGSILTLSLGDDPMRVPAIPKLNRLLERMGPTLEHLELQLPSCRLPDPTIDMISLEHNMELKKLSLAVYISSKMSVPVWVPDMLLQLPSAAPNIEILILTIGFESGSAGLAGIGLERIDEIMTGREFGRLQTVWINAGNSIQAIADVRRRMKRLNGRNLLKLAYESLIASFPTLRLPVTEVRRTVRQVSTV